MLVQISTAGGKYCAVWLLITVRKVRTYICIVLKSPDIFSQTLKNWHYHFDFCSLDSSYHSAHFQSLENADGLFRIREAIMAFAVCSHEKICSSDRMISQFLNIYISKFTFTYIVRMSS